MGGILFSTSLDIRLAAAMFAAILIFTLVWEELTQMLEEHLANDIHFLQMISKVYREMMILGFISLAVVLSNEFHLIKGLFHPPGFTCFTCFTHLVKRISPHQTTWVKQTLCHVGHPLAGLTLFTCVLLCRS